jgi:MOSC domain-containing protein YiiM
MDSGRVLQINVSNGGVPKLSRAAAHIRVDGVEGDRQSSPEIHGGVNRAVCIFALEQIQALQAEGHPIYPGAIGENLTVSGLDWPAMVPGVRLQFAGGVLLEVVSYTNPCKNIAGAFVDGQYGRVSQKQHPGWSRVYARVLQPGLLQPGEQFEFLPAP